MIESNEEFNRLLKKVEEKDNSSKSNFDGLPEYLLKGLSMPLKNLIKKEKQQTPVDIEAKKNCYRRINKTLRNINESSFFTMLPPEDLDRMDKREKEKEMENKERKYMDTDTNSYSVKKKNDREHPRFDREKIMDAVRMFIEAIGDDPNREGLLGTPDRISRMVEELFEGMSYTNDQIAEMFNTSFETSEDNEDLVTVGQIPIGSFCEHHLMPMVNMTASIGYIPVKGRVVGLSKLARIAMLAASRLQLQEKIGEDIAYIVQKVTGSPDVIVVIEGEHTCMTMRGIRARGSLTRTATLRGRFRDNVSLRQEFYSLIKA